MVDKNEEFKKMLKDPVELAKYRTDKSFELTREMLNLMNATDGIACLIALVNVYNFYKNKMEKVSPLVAKEIIDHYSNEIIMKEFAEHIEKQSAEVIIKHED